MPTMPAPKPPISNDKNAATIRAELINQLQVIQDFVTSYEEMAKDLEDANADQDVVKKNLVVVYWEKSQENLHFLQDLKDRLRQTLKSSTMVQDYDVEPALKKLMEVATKHEHRPLSVDVKGIVDELAIIVADLENDNQDINIVTSHHVDDEEEELQDSQGEEPVQQLQGQLDKLDYCSTAHRINKLQLQTLYGLFTGASHFPSVDKYVAIMNSRRYGLRRKLVSKCPLTSIFGKNINHWKKFAVMVPDGSSSQSIRQMIKQLNADFFD